MSPNKSREVKLLELLRSHNIYVLHSEIYRSFEGKISLTEWEELFISSKFATPFQSYEWISTWLKWFGRNKRPYIYALYDGDELVGVMPMYEVHFPLRTLKPIGLGQSDYLHPLIKSGYEEFFCSSFSEHLNSLTSKDFIDLQNIRETHLLLHSLKGAKVVSQEGCYVLDLSDDYEQYLSTLNGNYRGTIRRKTRDIMNSSDYELKTVAHKDEIEPVMNALFELHTKRWRKSGLPGNFSSSRVKGLHLEFAYRAFVNDRLRLSYITHKEKIVAVLYAICTGDSCYFYQSGIDPELGQISAGVVLVGHAIRSSIEEGLAHFDFMRGDEAYKARWKPQNCYRNLRVLKSYTRVRGWIGELVGTTSSYAKNKIQAQLSKGRAN